jgi:hypothetical protein
MQRSIFIVVILVLASFVIAPIVSAAPSWWPIVPCGLNPTNDGQVLPSSYYQPCNQCELFHLLKNLIDFIMLGVMPIVGTLFIVFAGFRIITAGGFPSQLSEGKKMLSQTLLGVFVICIAWLGTNTVIRSLAKDNIAQDWWKFQCRAPAPTTTPSVTGTPTTCTDLPGLAQSNNVPYPRKNSAQLDQLIACVRNNASVAQLLDTSQIYTFERTNDACNYTRGREICGGCQHRTSSCHYGGSSGTQGSEGVDFNSTGSEQELYNRLRAVSSQCNFGAILFESNHTHVSTQACGGN